MYRQIRQPKRMREQKGRVFAPFCTALLHAASRTSGGFHSHFSTVQCPFIPSLRLSGWWRLVILTVRGQCPFVQRNPLLRALLKSRL